MVQDIISPANRAQISPKRATVMTYILGFVGANLFRTPVRNGTDSEIHGISSNSIGTPVPPVPQKMSILFNNKSNEVKFSYIGKLEFLDNQKKFEKTFGDKPLNPVSQYSSTALKRLYAYSEKCKLDVFLHMCRKYYMVHDSVDIYLSTQEVCG